MEPGRWVVKDETVLRYAVPAIRERCSVLSPPQPSKQRHEADLEHDEQDCEGYKVPDHVSNGRGMVMVNREYGEGKSSHQGNQHDECENGDRSRNVRLRCYGLMLGQGEVRFDRRAPCTRRRSLRRRCSRGWHGQFQ